jgi:hypothetical protein
MLAPTTCFGDYAHQCSKLAFQPQRSPTTHTHTHTTKPAALGLYFVEADQTMTATSQRHPINFSWQTNQTRAQDYLAALAFMAFIAFIAFIAFMAFIAS